MTQDPPITQVDRELLQSELSRDDGPFAPAYFDGTAAALRAIGKARQQGREQGLREAAEVCEDLIKVTTGERDEWPGELHAYEMCKDEILALIDKPGGAV